MRNRLIIEGNTVYELDEECMRKKQGRSGGNSGSCQNSFSQPGKQKGQNRPM